MYTFPIHALIAQVAQEACYLCAQDDQGQTRACLWDFFKSILRIEGYTDLNRTTSKLCYQ